MLLNLPISVTLEFPRESNSTPFNYGESAIAKPIEFDGFRICDSIGKHIKAL